MEDYDLRSAASILASVKEQEARFERLTRALEEERHNVSVQLERSNLPASVLGGGNGLGSHPLPWQQVVMQVEPLCGVCRSAGVLHPPAWSPYLILPCLAFTLPPISTSPHHLCASGSFALMGQRLVSLHYGTGYTQLTFPCDHVRCRGLLKASGDDFFRGNSQ
ncbi:unnamed protein product [Arctogadus glacialis]